MLKYELNGDILHVTQTIISADKTEVEHWYYDIKNWKCSSNGKLNDVLDRDMEPNAVTWVKKYYLPKVKQ